MIALVASFNRFIDPYALNDGPVFKGINTNKPEFSHQLRSSKAYAIRHLKPEAIILGSSRAEYGIDPASKFWPYKNVYNLGLKATNISEITSYLKHSNTISDLKLALVLIDFRDFNASFYEDMGFNDSILSFNDSPYFFTDWLNFSKIYLSLDSLLSSFKTILKQHVKSIYHSNGFIDSADFENRIKKVGGYRNSFRLSESSYFNLKYKDYSFVSNTRNYIKDYEELVRYSAENNIDLRIVFSPVHVRQLETIRLMNLWPMYENWKSIVACINHSVSSEHGLNPYPIWDFSSYQGPSTESFPLDGLPMQYYWDSSHFKSLLGEKMLLQIFNESPIFDFDTNFQGKKLTCANVSSHNEALRAQQKKWILNNPITLTELSNLFNIEAKGE